jgi:ceramide glucosyltransferase
LTGAAADGMAAVLTLLTWLAALLTAAGLVAVAAGAVAVQRFAASGSRATQQRPAVTVMKPLCGEEPLLEAALASICRQDYPTFQVVFGVQDENDPALLVVQRVQQRFPACDIAVTVNATLHGLNRKVSNLINMMPEARHDVLVFSDSDLHVPPDYLDRIVARLEQPGTGLVTSLCIGLPTVAGTAAQLGATGISHLFLPGALLSRALGREDCLGTTMALRRGILARVGGLQSLVRHLADDNVLAQRVRQLGLRVGLASTVPMTAVPETSLRALWEHEMRWARTIRALEPALFVTSVLQFPLFWAACTCVLAQGEAWSVGLFGAAWAVRALAALWINRWLRQGWRPAIAVPFRLLPLRDALSVSQVVASYLGARVVWRGHVMHADDGRSAMTGV